MEAIAVIASAITALCGHLVAELDADGEEYRRLRKARREMEFTPHSFASHESLWRQELARQGVPFETYSGVIDRAKAIFGDMFHYQSAPKTLDRFLPYVEYTTQVVSDLDALKYTATNTAAS